MKIAFIGLGNMGSGMASNLVKAAHEVHIYDINPQIIKHLSDKGFVIHKNLDTAVKDADAVVTMLPEGEHVKEVYLSKNGVINNVKENTILIDCSTIDIESIKKHTEELNQVWSKISEKVYQQTQENASENPSGNDSSNNASDDNIEDADFEVVEDEAK